MNSFTTLLLATAIFGVAYGLQLKLDKRHVIGGLHKPYWWDDAQKALSESWARPTGRPSFPRFPVFPEFNHDRPTGRPMLPPYPNFIDHLRPTGRPAFPGANGEDPVIVRLEAWRKHLESLANLHPFRP